MQQTFLEAGATRRLLLGFVLAIAVRKEIIGAAVAKKEPAGPMCRCTEIHNIIEAAKTALAIQNNA